MKLRDIGWDIIHASAFHEINAAIANTVTLSYPRDDYVTCVFTDASDTHWAGVITQCHPDELKKPFQEQCHEPLAFTSGAFTDTEVKWPTIEKEAFAILETMLRCEHLVRRDNGVSVFTDHANLKYILSPDPAVFNSRRQAADRVERWGIILRSFTFSIYHIPGEHNVCADLLTRWGASEEVTVRAGRVLTRSQAMKERQQLSEEASKGKKPQAESIMKPAPANLVADSQLSLSTGSAAGLTKLIQPSDRPSTPTTKTSAAAPTPRAQSDDNTFGTRIENGLKRQLAIEFGVADHPSDEEIIHEQHAQVAVTEATRLGLHQRADDNAWIDSKGRLYIPDTRNLRLRLIVTAHQGLGGHRSWEATVGWMKSRIMWPTMEQDTRTIVRACLHCLRCKGGRTIPRPWLSIPTPDGPNKMIHFDFFHVVEPTDESQPQYVLVIVDAFSRFSWLVPCHKANAKTAATALMQWFALFGVVRHWGSDNGRHFQNEVLTHLASMLGADHHFTAAYAPWSNGLVERLNREVRTTLGTLTSEAKLPPEAWPLILPAVNSVLNSSPSSSLGGLSPMEVFTGRTPTSPLDVVFTPDAVGVATAPTSIGEMITKTKALADELERRVGIVRDHAPRPRPLRPGQTNIDFDVGDFVLTARGAKRKADKTAPIWEGPALITRAVNERTFAVKNLLTGVTREMHADHIKRYADKHLHVTTQLKEFIAASAVCTQARLIDGHRLRKGKWELKILWEGFDDEEFSWEPLSVMMEDIPAMVSTYIKTVQDSKTQHSLQQSLSQ